jgi:hypothetical protein
MSTNIFEILSPDIDDNDDNLNKDKILEIGKNNVNNYIENQINQNELQKVETDAQPNIPMLPIKKKKGRKSKQTKLLEQEEIERNRVPPKLFPELNEKIFDVIKINDKEYFLDCEFGTIYDEDIKHVGIIKNNEYLMYSDIENNISKILETMKTDKNEINHMTTFH